MITARQAKELAKTMRFYSRRKKKPYTLDEILYIIKAYAYGGFGYLEMPMERMHKRDETIKALRSLGYTVAISSTNDGFIDGRILLAYAQIKWHSPWDCPNIVRTGN